MPSVTPLPPPSEILLWKRELREKKCSSIVAFDDSLKALIGRLTSTCYVANGVGLAAPQIGEFVRVVLIHWPMDVAPYPLINPVIDEINSKGEQVAHEACLSLPMANNVVTRVRRCNDVVFSYQDIDGKKIESKATGMLARIIQHEVDHLSGYFYVDRVGDLSRSLVMKNYQKFLKEHPELRTTYLRRAAQAAATS